MSLSCGCDVDEYVDLDPDHMSRAPNTIICRECGYLIKPGEDYYKVMTWVFGDWHPELGINNEGEEVEKGIREVCEGCGDLAYTILELGYCYTFGSLRSDVREMAAIEQQNRLEYESCKKRKQERTNGTK